MLHQQSLTAEKQRYRIGLNPLGCNAALAPLNYRRSKGRIGLNPGLGCNAASAILDNRRNMFALTDL